MTLVKCVARAAKVDRPATISLEKFRRSVRRDCFGTWSNCWRGHFSLCLSSRSIGRTSANIADFCSHVIAFRRCPAGDHGGVLPPLPSRNFRHVIAALRDVLLVIDELVVDRLLEISGPCSKLRQPVNHILA